MKKLLFTIICALCFVTLAKAESCTIISGDGTKIGDEIDCAGERFYIFGIEDENVKLFAKYNLYAGYNLKKTAARTTTAVGGGGRSEAREYCETLGNNFQYRTIKQDSDADPLEYYCIGYEDIPINPVKQDKKATGTQGLIPIEEAGTEYGLMPILSNEIYSYKRDSNTIYNVPYYDYEFAEYDYTTRTQTKKQHKALTLYKETLNDLGIEIKEIDIPSINDIDGLINKVTNKNLPLESWKNSWEGEENQYSNYDYTANYRTGNIKEVVNNNKYDWLWSTSYWLRTMWLSSEFSTGVSGYVYFVEVEGNLIASNTYSTSKGGGIRPLITIDKSAILSSTVEPENKEEEEKPNPKTSDVAIITLIILLILSVIVVMYNKKKLDNI